MYDPVKDGVAKTVHSVTYTEVDPPSEWTELVHSYWELKTDADLSEDFVLHALPDACVNLLFNQHDVEIAGVTALHTAHTTLNLGRSFHYVGVQLFPGAWSGALIDTVDHYVGEPYAGDLPLIDTNRALVTFDDFTTKTEVLTDLIAELAYAEIVSANPVTAAILKNIDDVRSVADMAKIAGFSPRQLQRRLKARTGFTPHDLLKVLRMQRSFREDYLLSYTDQPHFIHSFRDLTGFTPARFTDTFDV